MQRGQKWSLCGHKVIESLLQKLEWPMLNCSEKVPVMRSHLLRAISLPVSCTRLSLSLTADKQRVYNRKPFLSTSSTKSIFVPALMIKQKWLSKCCHHFQQNYVWISSFFPISIIKPKELVSAVSRSVASIHTFGLAQELPMISIQLFSATLPAPHLQHCWCTQHYMWRADPAVQWPPRTLWMDGLSGPVWLETGVCHLRMKAQPINIIGEHLLLVTTQGELDEPPPHPTPHPSATPESGCTGSSHPSLTVGMLAVGCMFGPGTCLPQPDQSCFWPMEDITLQRTWKMPQGAHPDKHLS